MKEKEVKAYMLGHENAFIRTLDIIGNYIDNIPEKMITDLEEFNQSVHYQADAIFDELTKL